MTKIEKIARDMLKEQGYLVEWPNKTRWGKTDFFSLWDLIAINDKHIRFIQVSSVYLTSGSHAKKNYTDFPKPPGVVTEFWRWDKKKKEFIIKEL